MAICLHLFLQGTYEWTNGTTVLRSSVSLTLTPSNTGVWVTPSPVYRFCGWWKRRKWFHNHNSERSKNRPHIPKRVSSLGWFHTVVFKASHAQDSWTNVADSSMIQWEIRQNRTRKSSFLHRLILFYFDRSVSIRSVVRSLFCGLLRDGLILWRIDLHDDWG